MELCVLATVEAILPISASALALAEMEIVPDLLYAARDILCRAECIPGIFSVSSFTHVDCEGECRASDRWATSSPQTMQT